jgi:uncharacterized protein YaeQ
MATGTTIYRATVQLADSDRGVYTELRATLARHPSETAERLVTRLLAYALFYEPGLVFTKGISDGDQPDLWVLEADSRVALWLEVGLPDVTRIAKACRHATRVLLFLSGQRRRVWEGQHLKRLAEESNLAIWTVEQSLIKQLSEYLERSIAWSVTVSGGVVYLALEGHSLETPLLCLQESAAK